MKSLFQAYELLAKSGLFDAEYYLRANPDIAALNIDPLLHYVEQGAQEGRDPRPDFDVAYYLEQCRLRGEEPANPLLHFITVGVNQGLKTRATTIPDDQAGIGERIFTATPAFDATTEKPIPVDPGAIPAAEGPADAVIAPAADQTGFGQPVMQLYVDSAEVDDAGILHIVGWAICLAPIVSVEVFIDDERLAAAEYGKPREDVASIHPQYPNAFHSGFALRTDISSWGGGDRVIKVQAVASTGISREKRLPFNLSGERRASAPYRDESKVQIFCDLIEVTIGGRFLRQGVGGRRGGD